MPQNHPILVCCTHLVLASGMPWEVTLTNDMQQRPIYELSFSAYLRLLRLCSPSVSHHPCSQQLTHCTQFIGSAGRSCGAETYCYTQLRFFAVHHPGCIKLPNISSFSVLTNTFTVYRYVTTPQRLRPCKRPWELLIWTKGAYKPCQLCSHTVIDRIPKVWYLDYTIQAR